MIRKAETSPGGEAAACLMEQVESIRRATAWRIPSARKSAKGQFLTPATTARLMASMLECSGDEVHILDPGAGVGSLFTAAVAQFVGRPHPPSRISVLAYEVENDFEAPLNRMLALCGESCHRAGIEFVGEAVIGDFVRDAAEILRGDLFQAKTAVRLNCAILNPPYHKIQSRSEHRILLRAAGIETSNLYTGFLALTVRLLMPGGEFVAITPRSFCNGPYFRPFRALLLSSTALRRIHVFEARNRAFREDDVLQENVILHAAKSHETPRTVIVSTSDGPTDDAPAARRTPYSEVVHPDDRQFFIRLVQDEKDRDIASKMSGLWCSLDDLGLAVSTGRVVGFRARSFLRSRPERGAAPLIHPAHFRTGIVRWPRSDCRKPNAILEVPETASLLVPSDCYVLVNRFSAKEEKRRIVAAVFDPACAPGKTVGFENHVNYFHRHGKGLGMTLACGLAAYLNSSIVDLHFRQFNGHTQVNATDLRNMKYPSLERLEALGGAAPNVGAAKEVDMLVERMVFGK